MVRTIAKALLLGASIVHCNSSHAEPVPPHLAAITRIEASPSTCGQNLQPIYVTDAELVVALVAEFSDLRLSLTGVHAAEFECPIRVRFYSQSSLVATFQVLGCTAFESASGQDKRYFAYKQGIGSLSQLAGLLGVSSRQRCK
jgi:hypothetical protein